VTDARISTSVRHFRRAAWLCAVLVVGSFLSAWLTDAHAQLGLFRGYRGPSLSHEDWASAQAAADKLLTEDQAQVGKSEDWVGPTSGNTGRLSVQKEFQRQGMECRTIRSLVNYKKASMSPPRIFNLDVCHTKSGEWKLI
jgi:hypothetical protein